MNPRIRLVIVALLGCWLLATIGPSVARLWAPLGVYGYSTDYDGTVDSIAPDGAAARAGMRIGDRVEVMRAASEDRRPFRMTNIGFAPRAGTPMTLPVLRGAHPVSLHLMAQAERLTTFDAVLLVLRTLSALGFVVVGAGLVLLRPSAMTWAFYLYCIGTEPGSVLASNVLLTSAFATPQALFVTIAGDLALLGAFSFAIRFPDHRTSIVRRRVELGIGLLVALDAAAEAYGDYALTALGMPMQRLFDITSVVSVVVTITIYATFFVTYLRAASSDRERIRYVIAGFTIALGATLAQTLLNRMGTAPYWVTGVLDLAGIAVPISVAYAVIRHRVMDISFVVSRTIVYGLLTSFVIVVYSLIDWLFSTLVSAARVEAIAQIAASVAIGFSLSKLQKRTDNLVDRVFFRTRYQAEARIDALTLQLPHADSMGNVLHALVDDAAEALDLASAAVFVRSEAMRELYERKDARGWEGVTVERLFTDEQIVGKLARTRARATIGDLDLDGCALPEGLQRPVLGVPIVAHDDVLAVVLYGQHRSGATLDPEEEKMLDRLAEAAAAAYDHIEAERLRSEIAAMAKTVTRLERRLSQSGGAQA